MKFDKYLLGFEEKRMNTKFSSYTNTLAYKSSFILTNPLINYVQKLIQLMIYDIAILEFRTHKVQIQAPPIYLYNLSPITPPPPPAPGQLYCSVKITTLLNFLERS